MAAGAPVVRPHRTQARALAAAALCSCAVAALPAAATAADAACPAVGGAATVPTLPEALGRPAGAAPASGEEINAYLRRLDAATDRVRVVTLGRSTEGRPILAAMAGDPRELAAARLAATGRAQRRVAGGAPAAEARRTAAGRPAFAWLTGSIHGNEPSGAEASVAVLRALATGTDCATRRRLGRLVTVAVPVQNPDGRAVGSRTDALGFDLNRDGLARARPETAARLHGFARYPPLAVADLHEQGGTSVFVPPYADPVLREVPPAARRLTDRVLGPAAARAIRGLGRRVDQGVDYDLLYPGFGDSAAAVLHGAAGMTFEVGSALSPADRIAAHRAGSWAALGALSAGRPAAVRRQAGDARAAVREGRVGRLGPDADGGRDRDAASTRVYAHVLRTDAHAGDALGLAARLRADGVRVRRLTRDTAVAGYDPWGPGGPRTARLPAGTLIVPAAQPRRRWAQALLAERPQSSGNGGSYDLVAWSQGLLAGVRGGVLRRPAPAARLGALRPVDVGPAAGVVRFDAQDAAGLRLALRAAARGRDVRRAGAGFAVLTDPALRADARRTGVSLRAGNPGAAPAPAPRAVLVDGAGPRLVGAPATLPRGDVPTGWTREALRRAGVTTTALAPAALALGLPAGTTHVVLPDQPVGATEAAGLRSALEPFVRGGGTVLAVGRGGVAALGGLSGLGTRDDAPQPGTIVATRVTGSALGLADEDSWGLPGGTAGLVLPAGASTVVRVASGASFASPGAGDERRLAGRPLVGVVREGAGRVVAFAGDPAFRADHDGGERLLLAALATR